LKPKARRQQKQLSEKIFDLPEPEPEQEPEPEPEPEMEVIRERIDTLPNAMGVYRSYQNIPSFDPDEAISLEHLCDSPGLLSSDVSQSTTEVSGSIPSSNSSSNFFAPFLNATIFHLMSWWYHGSGTKSTADLDRLVQDVILQDDFDRKDLEDFSATRECARLDKPDENSKSAFSASSGWTENSVKIRLPAEYRKFDQEKDAPEFEVPGVLIRSLVNVIQDAFQGPAALTFHMTPFRHFWLPSKDEPPVRLYSELYSSDAMLDEHDKISAQPREPGPQLETVVAAIMLWSDSTHLANFGNASLWPIYAFFGNQSKYSRAKPTSFACHHLAYVPSVCASKYKLLWS
jgi:hypothetical protein